MDRGSGSVQHDTTSDGSSFLEEPPSSSQLAAGYAHSPSPCMCARVSLVIVYLAATQGFTEFLLCALAPVRPCGSGVMGDAELLLCAPAPALPNVCRVLLPPCPCVCAYRL